MEAIDDLVTANAVLSREGVLDAFGHVSVRHPEDAAHFLLSRHRPPALVTAADIRTFDLEGNVLDGGGEKQYSELPIHAAVYAARPDVGAVVHSHDYAIIPFAVTAAPMRPVIHTGSFLGEGVARFDTQDVAGDTDLLIRSMPLARALAGALGERPVVLMRGHGCVVVGSSIPQAVHRAVYTHVNATLQAEAMRLGAVRYLTDGEVRIRKNNDAATAERTWMLWKAELSGDVPGDD